MPAAQINVQNLFNEKYYTGIRNNVNATTGVIGGGWAVPGDRRSLSTRSMSLRSKTK